MPERVLRVGTRSSDLALWQTSHVIARLEGLGLACERVSIRTLGDRVKDVPLPRLGDRGLFTREIEAGLRDGSIDVAVHSLKDLPTDQPADLVVAAVLEREDPRDVLVSASGATLAALPSGARVGTSSVRRRAQLLARRPDLQLLDIRGNVPTRIEKVRRGDYDATLLALAGVKRLGLTAAVTEIFAPTVLLPAPGQGALAVQVRADDEPVRSAVSRLDHAPTRLATAAERGILNALEGGCQAPIGTIGSWLDDGRLRLEAIVASYDGTTILRAMAEGGVADLAAALELSAAAAQALRERGADEIVQACRAAIESWPGLPEGEPA